MSTREFWDALTAEETAAFTRQARRRQWPRGGVLLREGERSDFVAVLLSGRVKASCHTADGEEIVLALRGPGALLGELSAVDHRPHSATVQALEPVTALDMTVADFQAYLQSHGRVALLLMRTLAGRLRDADRKRVEFGAYDTTGRVAARLVELAERFGSPDRDGIHIALPISQDELAGWIGASREAVSKALGTLRAAGWITTSRRQVVIHDLDALSGRAARPPARP